jgi:holo-[acyl-carrier protein] synthase
MDCRDVRGVTAVRSPASAIRRRRACYRGEDAQAALVLIGIGLDLVEAGRVERALARFGERFVGKLMDPAEAAALPLEPRARADALASAIAAKEAASKALGTGWSQGVRWRDVVATLAPFPSLRLEGRAAEVARGLGSSGRTRTRLERRGTLVIGEVWLLS